MSKLDDMLDPQHRSFDLFGDPFVKEIWEMRYKAEGEKSIFDTFERVANAVYAKDAHEGAASAVVMAYEALRLGLFMPAGRILSSAGLDTKSTLQNCYVNCKIEDSMEGIHAAYSDAMVTLGRFGGIGTDFTPIRPRGARVGTQGLVSPGVVKWMEMFHDGASRIMQAGHRRGAMMGTLADHHPDILDFIEAKHTKGALTNFNVSILISDAFMTAVKDDAIWELWHEKPTAELASMIGMRADFKYIYKALPARELWDKIMRSTYEFSEPGVIFIDKINQDNNLWYCEDIRCTNPCGEQPLPPYGACNLGHINLARMVIGPFQKNATVNMQLLTETVKIAVRFLDNVIDVSNFPLDGQYIEQQQKRRIGLGVSGLADMLIQLGMHYDSLEARVVTERVMKAIAETSYIASMELAETRGPFPLCDTDKYGSAGFARKMLMNIGYSSQGIRNSLLLTVAPTGTVSIVYGNISSGIEPNFAWRVRRKVWGTDGQPIEHTTEGFISRFLQHCSGNTIGRTIEQLDAAVTSNDLKPKAHVQMQAVVQKWIDASVTKTVNCPPDIDFEDFQHIYFDAYESGCKGCTTYRPSDVRGSVIEDADKPQQDSPDRFAPSEATAGISELQPGSYEAEVTKTSLREDGRLEMEFKLKDSRTFNMDFADVEHRILGHMYAQQNQKRPELLVGCTYKIKWPHHSDNIYLTINEFEGRPWEVFIASMDLRNIEWMVLACIQLSKALRRGEDPIEQAKLFQKVQGASEGSFVGTKYYTSLVSYIGQVLERHFERYSKEEDWGLSTGMSATGRFTSSMPTFSEIPRESPVGNKMSGVGNLAGEEVMEMPSFSTEVVKPACPKCRSTLITKQEGCEKCLSCGHSKCG